MKTRRLAICGAISLLSLLSCHPEGTAIGPANLTAIQREGAATTTGAVAPVEPQSEFAVFVDGWLDAFSQRHPSIAAGNGLHAYDDRLEDFSAAAIEAEIYLLRQDRTRLVKLGAAGFATARAGAGGPGLTLDEEVDRRILLGIVDGWLLDLKSVQNWRKNPMIYAAAVEDGVRQLMTMEGDAPEARAARVVAKLKKVPALLDQARTNIVNPPAIFAKRGAEMMRGAAAMLTSDVPLAFARIDPARMLALRDESTLAAKALDAYARQLDAAAMSPAAGGFAVGPGNLAARYAAEELIDLPLLDLVSLGERELRTTQAEFRHAAEQISADKPPLETWQAVLADHPARGELLTAARNALGELTQFVRSRGFIALPADEPLEVAAAPEFDLGLASMHSSPPLEPHPIKSYFYITDAQSNWPIAKQDEWLRRFNRASLAVIAAHEAMPGHWVHSVYMRRTPGKIRRIWIGLNPFPQPSSGQDGWAHYAEQLVADEGFRAGDPSFRLAQIGDSLTRICRLLVSTRMHTEGWSIDQGARFFEENAYLPPPAAQREAERSTYDPTNGGYFLGKRALLKLRREVAAREGASFDLARFHARVMSDGIAPWAAHRLLILGEENGRVID